MGPVTHKIKVPTYTVSTSDHKHCQEKKSLDSFIQNLVPIAYFQKCWHGRFGVASGNLYCFCSMSTLAKHKCSVKAFDGDARSLGSSGSLSLIH